MKKLLTILLACSSLYAGAQLETFTSRTITSGVLDRPWEVLYGPNDSLWVTEAQGYKITRWSTGATISHITLLDLTASKADWASTTSKPQGGLMGLAIHPALYSSDPAVRQAKPWVYVAYVYAKAIPNTDCPNGGSGCFFSTRISRFEYRNNQLINEQVILNNMPGSSDHNSGRLVISPAIETAGGGLNDQYRLYYSIGDMGSGQFANTTRANNAQNQNIMEGKILRINTESDGDGGQDQWVPDNNPFYNASSITPQDYVFSYGHRNPQGLVWGSMSGTRRLYSSEQSDRADDEINVITAGSNYGWDKVSGHCDGDVNGFKIGGQNIINEVTNCAGTVEPIFTMFGTGTYPANGTAASTWPTKAITSVAFYGSNKIPGWYGSLLVSPIKAPIQIYRLKLNASGTAVTSSHALFSDIGGTRLRRITVSLDGLKFYVTRDDGRIVEYRYTGAISTLPIQLLSFKGSLADNMTQLQWETATESNTAKFNIERSLDGTNYSVIGTVAAAGNSSNQINYSYSDKEATGQPASILYYRLKMIDIDEQFSYSNIITISLASSIARVNISPNPVNNEARVNINTLTDGKLQWQLMDNSGRVLMNGLESMKSGNNQILLNTSGIAAGIYYLQLNGSGIDSRLKLQKL